MTLPQRIALIVKRCMALLHPCVYGELNSRDTVQLVAAELEKEVAMLCPGRDAKAIVATFVARLGEEYAASGVDIAGCVAEFIGKLREAGVIAE